MKNLEDFIKDNSEMFDVFEPENGHFERFEQKIVKQNSDLRKFKFMKIKVVAIFIFVIFNSLIISYYFYQKNNFSANNQSKTLVSYKDVSVEYQEIDAYFRKDIDNKMSEFYSLNCNIDIKDKYEIIKDLNEIDYSIENLKTELKNNKNNEKIKEAIINSYKSKSNLLQKIIIQIKASC